MNPRYVTCIIYECNRILRYEIREVERLFLETGLENEVQNTIPYKTGINDMAQGGNIQVRKVRCAPYHFYREPG